MASAFTSMNRNKRSLAVDLQKMSKIARQLILFADVVENFDLGLWIGWDWDSAPFAKTTQNSFMPLSTVWGLLGLRKPARL